MSGLCRILKSFGIFKSSKIKSDSTSCKIGMISNILSSISWILNYIFETPCSLLALLAIVSEVNVYKYNLYFCSSTIAFVFPSLWSFVWIFFFFPTINIFMPFYHEYCSYHWKLSYFLHPFQSFEGNFVSYVLAF